MYGESGGAECGQCVPGRAQQMLLRQRQGRCVSPVLRDNLVRRRRVTLPRRFASKKVWLRHALASWLFVPVLAIALGQSPAPAPAGVDEYRNLRLKMVKEQIEARGVK